MAFGINSNRGEGEGKPEQTAGGGWDTAEPSHARSGTSPSASPRFLREVSGCIGAPVPAGASCLHRSSAGAPRPDNHHRPGEHRDPVPQAAPSHSARKKVFQGGTAAPYHPSSPSAWWSVLPSRKRNPDPTSSPRCLRLCPTGARCALLTRDARSLAGGKQPDDFLSSQNRVARTRLAQARLSAATLLDLILRRGRKDGRGGLSAAGLWVRTPRRSPSPSSPPEQRERCKRHPN